MSEIKQPILDKKGKFIRRGYEKCEICDEPKGTTYFSILYVSTIPSKLINCHSDCGRIVLNFLKKIEVNMILKTNFIISMWDEREIDE